MQFQLEKGMEDFLEGTRLLLEERGHTLGGKGICIHASQDMAGSLKVNVKHATLIIGYEKKVHYYRGLMKGLCFLEGQEMFLSADYSLCETVWFDSMGAMFDCSRNGVLKVDTIKKYIRRQASLGIDALMLYTEDTYEVEGEPYFGAFRGRFTGSELKECDEYAELFGIEVIPCIQTLAHLHTPLRWQALSEYKDSEDIVMVGSEKVYGLIEKMVKSISSPLRSKKIHLGMDEAHGLGLGKYLDQNGYKTKAELMRIHLDRVSKICKENGLEPMIWSDMYLRPYSATGEYYDLSGETDLSKALKPPKEVGLVYWDYYHDKEEHYINYFNLHKQLSENIIFAGGGWTWNGIAPNYSKMKDTLTAGLSACRKEGIKNVICTLWQDNGAETPMIASALPLVVFSEYGFAKEVGEGGIKESFEFLWQEKYEAFWLLDQMDAVPGTRPNNMDMDNPSKWLLYQDILMGLFDKQIQGLELSAHYEILSNRLEDYVKEASGEKMLLQYYQILAKLLSRKAEMGIRVYDAYHKKEMETLKEIANKEIPGCTQLVRELRDYREALWFCECKPFGYEILDIRFSGVEARLRSAGKRLNCYINGEAEKLEELEEERLLYCRDAGVPKHQLCSSNLWQSIISAGNIAGI